MKNYIGSIHTIEELTCAISKAEEVLTDYTDTPKDFERTKYYWMIEDLCKIKESMYLEDPTLDWEFSETIRTIDAMVEDIRQKHYVY